MRSLAFLLIIGFALVLMAGEADADEPLPLYGGDNWAEVDNEPPEVSDGAIGVTWNQTGVATVILDISILGTQGGYSPSAPEAQVGTTVTWTNDDTTTHTVTDKDGEFDSFDIPPGETYSRSFNEVGTFGYYCKYHPMMEGSITVLSDSRVDEQARTDFLKIWTAESNLIFWANFNMSDDDTIEVVAQKKGHLLNSSESIPLNDQNGFSILCLSNGTTMGDSLIGSTDDEWKKYQIYLDSQKLGYNGFDYDPYEDNAYSFVFRVRGIEGSAAIGGVQLIRTLDTGFYFGKADDDNLNYDIFPSLGVEIDYFVKNIGIEDNTFRITPELDAQGHAYDGDPFDIIINIMMNGVEFNDLTSTPNVDGTYTYEFDTASDDVAVITVRFDAPDYDLESGEPAGNRKFDVIVNGYDVENDESLREPMPTSLFIKPSQFVLGEISFNRNAVLEGDSLDITAKVWNEGNYASDVLVIFYVLDEEGSMYATPDGNQRLTRIASISVALMEPKLVLEDKGIYKTWYYATATWDEAFTLHETVMDYEDVEIYTQINPQLEQQDLDKGFKNQDEYQDTTDDNGGYGSIKVMNRLIKSVNCYVEGYDVSLQSFLSLSYLANDPCSEDEELGFSLIASEDGSGVWTIQIVKVNPQTSVNSVHWYLLDTQGNIKTDGLASDVYGYYSGQGKAIVFIDNDFNGKLSPGDKFEVHPGEADSDLANVNDVYDYSFRIRLHVDGEPVQEEESNLLPWDRPSEEEVCTDGDTKMADDGCNQCLCSDEEWVCTEVDCNPDDNNDDNSNLTVPSVSLIPALISIGLIAIYRRK